MSSYARTLVRRATAAPRRLALVATVLVIGCALVLRFAFEGSSAQVTPPRPDARAAPLCRALDKALPRTLQGRQRHDPEPASPYTAAWDSSPRTVLKCGVPVPQLLIEHPDSDAVGVNGVDWLIEKQGDGGYRFTTVERRANVELTVPAGAFPNATDALPDISTAVARTVPSRFLQ